MRINVKDISFQYNPLKKVLSNIRLDLDNESIIAIVGASGSGKSTFLRILAGIIQKTKKNIFEGEVILDNDTPSAMAKKGQIGFMFQEPTLLPNMTVQENISFPLKLKGNFQSSVVDELMKMVGLDKYASYLPYQLSGGMKTRVALARTFITRPKLLLLDEPFSSIDIRWKISLYKELENLRLFYQPTIILVTHDIQEAVHLSNHIIVFGTNGTVLNEILLDKPLPRPESLESLKDLQEVTLQIQNLIIADK